MRERERERERIGRFGMKPSKHQTFPPRRGKRVIISYDSDVTLHGTESIIRTQGLLSDTLDMSDLVQINETLKLVPEKKSVPQILSDDP
ncbi:unnamed protein product [Musa hybrid cultivar]